MKDDKYVNHPDTKAKLDQAFYTDEELARIFDISKRALVEYIKQGRIRAIKIGKVWIISQANLISFLNGDNERAWTMNRAKEIARDIAGGEPAPLTDTGRS